MKINLKSNHIKIISIICSLLIPLMVTGPFLPDLIISLLSIWFLYFSINQQFLNKNYFNKFIKKKYLNIYFYFFMSFCFVCILSSLISDDILKSLKSSLFYFRIGILGLLISFLIDKHKKILDYFYLSFIVTFSILIVDGYFQHISGTNFFGYKMSGIRVSSIFGDELILGSYLSRLFPLFFAIFVIRKNKKPIEIYLVSLLFIFIDVLIFITGERAAFFLLNLSTFFIILFISKYKYLRASLFVISLIIVGFLNSTNAHLYFRYIELPLQSMGLEHIFENQTTTDSIKKQNSEKFYWFSKGHDSVIRTGFNMFLNKPILGQGPKLFRIHCEDKRFSEGVSPCKNHPHNFYIQLLAETGIIGFLFLFGLLIHFLVIVIKHSIFSIFFNKKLLTDYQICLLAGLLITIWPLIPSGSFFNNQLMLFYGLQMGFFRKKI